MASPYFPLYMDLEGNNCGIMGGGEVAAQCARALVHCGARITVVNPVMCQELRQMEREGHIRHIPRKFFRGDCSHMVLCIAATGNPTVNIAISQECKAKGVPVFVVDPPEYGSFRFPTVLHHGNVTVSLSGEDPAAVEKAVADLHTLWPEEEPL